MKRPQWLKEVMKTPGPIKVQLLLLTTLTISSVTSTVLQISSRVNNISDGKILPSVESLEVGNAVFRLRVTGKSTTEVLRSLSKTLKSMDETFSSVRSSVSTTLREE